MILAALFLLSRCREVELISIVLVMIVRWRKMRATPRPETMRDDFLHVDSTESTSALRGRLVEI